MGMASSGKGLLLLLFLGFEVFFKDAGDMGMLTGGRVGLILGTTCWK